MLEYRLCLLLQLWCLTSCICMLEYWLCLLLQLWCLTVMYLYVGVSTLSPSTIVMFDVMYLYVRVSSLPPSTIVMFDGHVFVCWSIVFVSFYNCDVWRSCICMLEYRICLLLQLWCLTVMYLYVRVSTLSPYTIVMFDGHVFVSWSIDFVSFYNCDVWRSCICMLEYRLCLLLQLWCLTSCICMLEYRLCLLIQLWCLTVMYLYVGVSSLSPSTIVMFDVMYLYVRVSSLSPSTIVMFDGHVFVC
jgi:hypothetical protein